MSDIHIYVDREQTVQAITIAPTGARGAPGTNGANGTNGGSTNAWNYNAKTNATSGYPTDGHLIWNNATQTSATSIIVSHLTDDDTDIELFLSFFVLNQKIFIQNRDDSSQNQVWQITGTPTVTGANTSTAYYTFPVTLVSSAGAAFTNNHSLLFGQIVVATNAVTSATTSNGTCDLDIESLTLNTCNSDFIFLADGAYDLGTGSNYVRTAYINTVFSGSLTVGYDSNGSKLGQIIIYSDTEGSSTTINPTTGGSGLLTLPSGTGTLALTSDITVTPTNTVTLTNKTLTSPAINSATFGTAATFNATSYTYGAGAAAAQRTALGLVSNADTLTSVYEWTKATGDYTATNVGTGTSSTATNVMQLNTLSTAGSSALLRSDANDFRAWQKYSGSRQAVDWSKKTIHFVRISSDAFSGADTIFRIYLGLPSTLTTVQDLQSANTAIGFKVINGVIFVQVSNGSAVTTTTTGVTMSAWLVYDCMIQSNGDGTWTATVNSTTVTGSGAPSATSAASNAALVMSATNGTTAAARRFFVNNQKSMQFD
jgi:hypothetical protein